MKSFQLAVNILILSLYLTSIVPALRAGIIYNDKQWIASYKAKILHTHEHSSICDQYMVCKQLQR